MSQINFLPDSYRDDLDRAKRRPLNFLAIGITAAALAGVWALGDRSSALANRAELLEQELAQIEQTGRTAGTFHARIAEVEARRAVAREVNPPVTTAQVIAAIARIAPEPIKLSGLQVIAHYPAPKPTPVEGDDAPQGQTPTDPAWLEVTLRGIAPEQNDIVRFTRDLSEHPLFTQVRPRSSGAAQTERVLAREFHIALRVDLEREFVHTGDARGGRP